jgi:hypothetical protein
VVKAKPHDPADMLMQVANVDYDEKADCPFWRARLALLTPDTEQLAAFSRLYGCTLTGLTSDQAFYVHQGKGGDGKSATHMALADIHGDYYRHARVDTFLEGNESRRRRAPQRPRAAARRHSVRHLRRAQGANRCGMARPSSKSPAAWSPRAARASAPKSPISRGSSCTPSATSSRVRRAMTRASGAASSSFNGKFR